MQDARVRPVMPTSPVKSSPEALRPEAESSGRGRLKYALLAMLVPQPRHGYELRGEWEALLGEVWPLNSSQIYTTLSQMQREGLVDAEIVPQDLMPPKKVYQLT